MRDRAVITFARIALGAAFLSAVASRFGLWGGGSWRVFEQYTAEVNSFLPAWTIPALARAATALELSLGVALILGWGLRIVALAAAALLAVFGLAMAVSFGLKSPLDYSVFSASGCALLLSRAAARDERGGNH